MIAGCSPRNALIIPACYILMHMYSMTIGPGASLPLWDIDGISNRVKLDAFNYEPASIVMYCSCTLSSTSCCSCSFLIVILEPNLSTSDDTKEDCFTGPGCWEVVLRTCARHFAVEICCSSSTC